MEISSNSTQMKISAMHCETDELFMFAWCLCFKPESLRTTLTLQQQLNSRLIEIKLVSLIEPVFWGFWRYFLEYNLEITIHYGLLSHVPRMLPKSIFLLVLSQVNKCVTAQHPPSHSFCFSPFQSPAQSPSVSLSFLSSACYTQHRAISEHFHCFTAWD